MKKKNELIKHCYENLKLDEELIMNIICDTRVLLFISLHSYFFTPVPHIQNMYHGRCSSR